MDDSIFEWMERTGLVDRVLVWLALITPIAVAGLAGVLRSHRSVEQFRHRWVLGMLAAPALLILWKIYNAIMNHFGLDTVAGLLASIGLFAAAAVAFTVLRLWLRGLLRQRPRALDASAAKEPAAGGYSN